MLSCVGDMVLQCVVKQCVSRFEPRASSTRIINMFVNVHAHLNYTYVDCARETRKWTKLEHSSTWTINLRQACRSAFDLRSSRLVGRSYLRFTGYDVVAGGSSYD